MRKRKTRPENPETLDEDGTEEAKGFFACYLLTSLSPRFKGHTYIGFTVNPRRRIRQHNGEIRCGAWRTKSKRPWEMVLCIYGFPTNVSALQFEWAWQHPSESLAVRQAAAAFKSFSGVANKISLAYTMLNLPAWKSLNITVNYFSTKYTHHGAVCPSLPDHMKMQVHSMDELLCYVKNDGSTSDGDYGMGVIDEESIEGINLDRAGHQLHADATDCFLPQTTGDSPGEQFGSSEEHETQHQGNLPASGLIRGLSSRLFASKSSLASSASEDGDLIEFIHEGPAGSEFAVSSNAIDYEDGYLGSFEEQSRLSELVTKGRSQYCFTSSNEVEVIDLLTPSPRCRVLSCSKKAKFLPRSSEIIDLTRSPSFIRL